MSEAPERFTDAPCPYCQTRKKVRNHEWLRWQRQKAGLGLNEMAKRLGFSGAYISDIELGRRRCTEEIATEYITLGKFAEAPMNDLDLMKKAIKVRIDWYLHKTPATLEDLIAKALLEVRREAIELAAKVAAGETSNLGYCDEGCSRIISYAIRALNEADNQKQTDNDRL